jgi:hypothetical protein
MDPSMESIGILVFIFVIIGLPIIYLVSKRAKIKRIWSELAEENSLEAKLGRWPNIQGEVDGRFFEMGSAIGRTLSGRATLNQLPQFYVNANVKGNVPEGLVAGKRGMLQQAGPVQTDNIEFNKKIWVDCPNKEAAQTYLTKERQEVLLSISKYDGTLRGMEDGNPAIVFLSRDGYKLKKEWMDERKNAILDAAKILDV